VMNGPVFTGLFYVCNFVSLSLIVFECPFCGTPVERRLVLFYQSVSTLMVHNSYAVTSH